MGANAASGTTANRLNPQRLTTDDGPRGQGFVVGSQNNVQLAGKSGNGTTFGYD